MADIRGMFDIGTFDNGQFDTTTTFAFSFSDGVILAESFSKVWAAYKSISDGSALAESISKDMTAVSSYTDGATIADSFTKVWTAYLTGTDGVTLSAIFQKPEYYKYLNWVKEGSASTTWTDIISSTVSWTKASTANPTDFWTKRGISTSGFTKRSSADDGIWTKVPKTGAVQYVEVDED